MDAWEIPLADACPSCGHWLVDVCGMCGECLLWSRPQLMYCSCGHLLTKEHSRPAPAAVHELSKRLQATAQGRQTDALPLLTGLDIEETVQLCGEVRQ
jgi:hypothetical protein